MAAECLNAPFGARCFLTGSTFSHKRSSAFRLNAPFGARCFLTLNNWQYRETKRRSLNAPFGARCFLTRRSLRCSTSGLTSLNAPFGARCFLTVRRIAPPVTRENVVPDRQWPKKHPSYQQARGQITRLFVATARIAAERLRGRRCPRNRRHRRRVAPP